MDIEDPEGGIGRYEHHPPIRQGAQVYNRTGGGRQPRDRAAPGLRPLQRRMNFRAVATHPTGIETLTIAGAGDRHEIAVGNTAGVGRIEKREVLAGEHVHCRGIVKPDRHQGAVGREAHRVRQLATRRVPFGDALEVGIVEPDIAIPATRHQTAKAVEPSPVAVTAIVDITRDFAIVACLKHPNAMSTPNRRRQVASIRGVSEMIDDLGQLDSGANFIPSGPSARLGSSQP